MRHGVGSGPGIVVGRLRDETLTAVRVTADPETPRLRVAAAAELSYRIGEALGEPLERRLAWRPGEPLYLTAPTPPLVGETIVERVTADRDDRSARLELRRRVRDRTRERASQVFGQTLESVRLLTDAVEDHEPIRAGTALASTEEPLLTVPPDVPTTRLVILPMLLAEEASRSSGPLGLLVFEEEELTFVLAVRGVPLLVRTAGLGLRRLSETVRDALGCSPGEAERALTSAARGELPPEAFRLVLRVLRPYLPLYAACWTLFRESLLGLPLPERLLVAGRWSSLLVRLYCRQPYVGRVLSPGASVRGWPLLDLADGSAALPVAEAEVLLPLAEVAARIEGILAPVRTTGEAAVRAGAPRETHTVRLR